MNNALVPYDQNPLDSPESQDKIERILSKAFSVWETRGRGWSAADFPVELEPPFVPLYYLVNQPQPPVFDDGRTPSFLGSLFGGKAVDRAAALASYRSDVNEYHCLLAEAAEPILCQYYNADFTELQIVLPKDLKLNKAVAENLLLSFAHLSHPVSFEIIGNQSEIVIQFAVTEKDSLLKSNSSSQPICRSALSGKLRIISMRQLAQ